MASFSRILGTGQVENRKMIKDKLIDEKKNVSNRPKLEKSKNCPKLDRFYCIGVTNLQKKIFLTSCQINL